MIYVLVEQGSQYHGGGEQVEIKLIDKPIVSNYPVRPNLILNAIVALLVGLVVSFVYVYLKLDKHKVKLVETSSENLPSASSHSASNSYLTPKE